MITLSDTQLKPRPGIKAYKVGKRNAKGRLEQAFVVTTKPGGGIALSRVRVEINSSERHAILVHFGRTYKIRWGGRTTDGSDVQLVKSVRPGDQEHFEHAALTLPAPWSVMGGICV